MSRNLRLTSGSEAALAAFLAVSACARNPSLFGDICVLGLLFKNAQTGGAFLFLGRLRPHRFHEKIAGLYWERHRRHRIFGTKSRILGVQGVDPMSEEEIFRQRAAECQRQAEEARSKEVSETLRGIAKTYLALAANEERSKALAAFGAGGSATPEPAANYRARPS